MKRLIAGLAVASAATFVTAVPAQAQVAPKNPLTAVKKQLVAGKGVKFTERTTVEDPVARMVFIRRTGTIGFRKNGVAASDITGKFNIKASDLGEDDSDLAKAMLSPERTIWLGKTSYLSGGIWSALLPEDKTWFKLPNGPTGGITGGYGQLLNVAEPATLKAMLKNAKAARGGYSGKITVSQARKVSPWFRATVLRDKFPAKVLKTEISWRLSVDAKGLPTRLVTTFPFGITNGTPKKSEMVSVDTRYTGWGTKVSIKAPTDSDASSKPKEGSEETLDNLDILNGAKTGMLGG
ncbi:hypothetical protein [Nonomuraea harbinensis]|uniref:LppX_LprAFG lipoprotein n=1 Tax=Nonomuraea harbinensis TaxID=1286938 RepID=A0ABW1BR76_9ACTN|nr:hypothetical protein [Nonomuraea harbinensis]